MLAQLGAMFAAVGSARERHPHCNIRLLAAIAAVAASVAGCTPATVPLAARDPADPGAKVAAVGYRSTPSISLRPSAPAPWRERNDSVAPSARPGR